MEHRFGFRQNVGLTALVRRRGWAGSVVASLRDISISGAFIEGPPEAFPLYSMVQIEATPPGGASTRLMTCRAMVARVAKDGVGLVFDQVRPAGLAPLFSSGQVQAERKLVAAALAPAETRGTGSSTQLPDSRRAGQGIA